MRPLRKRTALCHSNHFALNSAANTLQSLFYIITCDKCQQRLVRQSMHFIGGGFFFHSSYSIKMFVYSVKTQQNRKRRTFFSFFKKEKIYKFLSEHTCLTKEKVDLNSRSTFKQHVERKIYYREGVFILKYRTPSYLGIHGSNRPY